MASKLIYVIILVSCAFFGGLTGYLLAIQFQWVILCAAAGAVLGGVCLSLVNQWLSMDAASVIGGTIGLCTGVVLSLLVYSGFSEYVKDPSISMTIYGFLLALGCLIGIQLGSSKAQEIVKRLGSAPNSSMQTIGILDTSVIIDGRVADVCDTGFLTGDLIIPQFVLHELQMIADSSESTKRTRGRRGLDILNKIQKQSYVEIIIDDTDYPSIKEVDQKLINMANETGYAILTNDFNLNKVAEVHSIKVLNINQLANALKPIVLPGETMKVQIIREGKEHGQGVAYLDDGTMVVVDHGRRFMSRTIEVTVTSVLQTTAGRMIFAVVKT
ncbi:PIN/TRAM domain-containing protein [Thermodesulfobacteriota bacterium]